MKICISSTGPNISDDVDPRFGRCQYFLIFDTETKKTEAISNQGVRQGSGAGVSAGQIIADKNVEAIITGNIGPNAFTVLGQVEVKIYANVFDLSCEEAIKKFQDNDLVETSGATGPGRHDHEPESSKGQHGSGHNK